MPFINVLKPDGKLILIGVPEKPHELPAFPLIMGKISAFSLIIMNLARYIQLHTFQFNM